MEKHDGSLRGTLSLSELSVTLHRYLYLDVYIYTYIFVNKYRIRIMHVCI